MPQTWFPTYNNDSLDGGQFSDAEQSEEMNYKVQDDDLDYNSDDQFMDADEPLFDFPMNHIEERNVEVSQTSELIHSTQGINFDCQDVAPMFVVDTIRCDVQVRHPTGIFKSLNRAAKLSEEDQDEARITWLHQERKIRETLNKLRTKDINVLIATSVVEEGIDVQACSFVVVFDAIKTIKSYIQMKGRARQENAKFFVFRCDKEVDKGLISLSVAQDMEKRVHQFLATRIPDCRELDNAGLTMSKATVDDNYDQLLPAELQALENGFLASKYGRIDLNSAKSLLNRYSLSAPLDPFARTYNELLVAQLPVYKEDHLFLPSYLPRNMRVVTLPERWRNNTQRKQREHCLALMACARLYSIGLLNERLLPLTTNDLQNRILQLVDRKLEEVKLRSSPTNNWQEAFVYVIQQSSFALNRCDSILVGMGRQLAVVSLRRLPMQMPTQHLRHRDFGEIDVTLHSEDPIELSQGNLDVLVEFFLMLMNSRWRRRTKPLFFRARNHETHSSVAFAYYVGLVTENNILDWDYMTQLISESRRTMVERINAVKSASTTMPLSSPRLWSPSYDPNIVYVCYSPSSETCDDPFPYDKEGVTTYKDYFKTRRGINIEGVCPLFKCQMCWDLPSKLSQIDDSSPTAHIVRQKKGNVSSYYNVCEELASVRLPRDACFEPALADPYIYLLSALLPQTLYTMERYIVTAEFIRHCLFNLPILGSCLENLQLELVLEALCAKSCRLDFSYDKLEWIGDAVLKLVQTHSLVHSVDLRQWIPFLHEGHLSAIRSAMGSNDRLEKICKILKFDVFVLTTPLERGWWTPWQLELCTPGERLASPNNSSNALSGKACADVLEAILGLVYVEFDYETAMNVAGELQLTLPWQDQAGSPKHATVAPKPKLLAVIRKCIGQYSFARTELLEEAFTHASALHPEVPSYQRLEWVGDAVLCLCAREKIYRQHYRTVALGSMVLMEGALVANEALAYISMKHGLPKLINHRDQSLPTRIESYEMSVNQLGRGLWGTDPPKVISDVVESLLGAIYLDGGWDKAKAAVVCLMGELFDYAMGSSIESDKIQVKHPKTAMQDIGRNIFTIDLRMEMEFAALNSIDMLVWHVNGWRKLDPKGQNYIARVQFLGNDLVLVADGSPIVARNRACAFVVSTLENDPCLLNAVKAADSKATKSLHNK